VRLYIAVHEAVEKGIQMRQVVLTLAMLVGALVPAAHVAAQGLPPGGYYADGAYYVPDASPRSAVTQAATNRPSACPPGYGVPIAYVAVTPTMVWIRPVGLVGSEVPGFPYVPVYASQPEC
jgi:hypothetical protein